MELAKRRMMRREKQTPRHYKSRELNLVCSVFNSNTRRREPELRFFCFMASNSGIANFGKRLLLRSVPTSLSLRRGVHVSVYDKDIDEHHSTIVPDELIPPQPENYWAPHPQTGVFGPATDQKHTSGGSTIGLTGTESVLKQKAFFRAVEDLDKPAI